MWRYVLRESESEICQLRGEEAPDQREIGWTARQDREVKWGKWWEQRLRRAFSKKEWKCILVYFSPLLRKWKTLHTVWINIKSCPLRISRWSREILRGQQLWDYIHVVLRKLTSTLLESIPQMLVGKHIMRGPNECWVCQSVSRAHSIKQRHVWASLARSLVFFKRPVFCWPSVVMKWMIWERISLMNRHWCIVDRKENFCKGISQTCVSLETGWLTYYDKLEGWNRRMWIRCKFSQGRLVYLLHNPRGAENGCPNI